MQGKSKVSKRKLINLSDQKVFNRFLSLAYPVLSSYNFTNIIIWKKIFEIFWHIIDNNLCLFFKNAGGCFMYIEPLGVKITKKVINECFAIMDAHNINKEFSRIENVPIKKGNIYKTLGFCWRERFTEYIYSRKSIAEFKGNKFKSQRSSYNCFINNYNFSFMPFSLKHKKECTNLLRAWKQDLQAANYDSYFCALLEDTQKVQEYAMDLSKRLGLCGRIVKVDKKIAGYSFGYPINNETWCILFEICNRQIKGISQYIFREFCRELSSFKYINTMDDSGLANIRRTKLLYNPIFFEKSGSVFRK